MEKVQCCTVLHVAEAEAQKLFHTLEIPEKDKIQPIIDAFKECCMGKANIIVMRYQFSTFQQTMKTIETYIWKLKQRIVNCNYGEMEKDLLCDRLVCGVKSDILCDKLLQTPNLSLQQCLQLCRLSEHSSSSLKSNMDYIQEKHVDVINKLNKYT